MSSILGVDEEALSRSTMIYGETGMARLQKARVAIFGIGGVGGMVAEALARTGIGGLDLFDYDRVDESNINRQLWATTETLGQPKTTAAARRLNLIRPQLDLVLHPVFIDQESLASIPFNTYDYVVDAVDTVTAKLLIIASAAAVGVPVISAMGAGNKVNPQAFEVARIEETSVCPLARVMRRELRKRAIPGVKVVYSKEKPLRRQQEADPDLRPEGRLQKLSPGSVMFAAGAAGLLLAAEVVSDLTGLDRLHD